MSLGFFLVNALDILDQLQSTSPEDRQHWIDWVYKCQTPNGGFRGSTATKTRQASIYDTAHLPATYFALVSLLILGDDLKRVNRQGALEALKRLQNEDGSFAPVLLGDKRFGEIDVRHVYCAIAVRDILSPIKSEEDINVSAAEQYIQKCKVVSARIHFTYHSLMMADMLNLRN
jgi:geranylgeranyl transferase type-1 subunit beta